MVARTGSASVHAANVGLAHGHDQRKNAASSKTPTAKPLIASLGLWCATATREMAIAIASAAART